MDGVKDISHHLGFGANYKVKHKKETHQGKDYRYSKPGTKKTIEPKEKGQKPIKFKEGSLHSILKVPQGTKIPAEKMSAAVSGKYGKAAKKKADFAKNVLGA